MPERRLFPEFRDQQDASKYPFEDAASLKPRTNSMQPISGDLFLDASLYPIGAAGPLYVNSILIESRLVTISIADQSQRTICSASFDPLAAPTVLPFADAYGRPAGVIVSDTTRLGRFGGWQIGEHTYAAGATSFVASCVIPVPAVGVRGLVTAQGEILTGDVLLVGDNGIVLRRGATASSIRVDVVGDPLYVRTLCGGINAFSTPKIVRTINGCPPDRHGNYNITVGDHESPTTIVRIYAKGDALAIDAIGQTIKAN